MDSLSDAEYCASGGRYTLAVNRLYYSCFYIASALLISFSIEAATHKGIKTMLNLHFVLTEKLERKYGKTFAILFESRQSGDYDDFVEYDEDDYRRLRVDAEDFIKAVKEIIFTSQIYQ